MKKYIFLLVLVLATIMYASSMSYEEQTIVPQLRELLHDKPLERPLSMLEIPYWGMKISVDSRGYFYFVEFLIRKASHFVGYGLVGTLFFLFYRKLKWRFAAFWGLLTVFLIACADEIRQAFSPGRTGVFSDVLLDSAGALFFITMTMLALSLVERFKNKT